MLKKALFILLAIVLLVTPLVIRWFYHYEGRYQPADVSPPDLTQIKAPALEALPFTEGEIAAASGTVLVDLAHDNRLDMAELNVLQARLAARGQRLEPVPEAGDLARQLRYAQALMIVSPGKDWAAEEIKQVQDFVAKGGRLLLITDPSRFEPIYDEWGGFIGLDHDAPHVNDLATRFGLVFQTDYLYNTFDNEGNFRNIKLTDFGDDALTRGIDQIVFNATHSIVSEEPALIAASGETRSSASERAGDLTVGLLAAGGGVLALGDLTFMTEPYSAVYDNDLFVANIADFLSGVQRQYDLADFPFFFGDQVDLVYTGDPLLSSGLLQGGSGLQDLFARQDKELTVRATEDDERDTLFLGLYGQAEEVEPYLSAAQVTLIFTPAQTIEETEGVEAAPSTSPGLTESLTTTPPITPTVAPAPEDAEKEEPAETEPEAGQAEPEASDEIRIAIEPLGEIASAGNSLLMHQTDGDRNTMIVLAQTEKGLESALERLTKVDLANCLFHKAETTVTSLVALCPTGETAKKEEGGGWQEPAPKEETPAPEPSPPPESKPDEPVGEPEGSIFVLALDEGTGRYDSLTSADDYANILEQRFKITAWSATQSGPPELEELLDHDLVILTTGDFEDSTSNEYGDLLFALMLEGTPVILSGAYASDATAEALQRDIQVSDAAHPLAKGFEADGVIEFVSAPSGQVYAVGVLEEYQEGEGSIVFVRGPNSEETDLPSIVAMDDDMSGIRLVFIGFPLYLLPEEPKSQLVLNAVTWLLTP